MKQHHIRMTPAIKQSVNHNSLDILRMPSAIEPSQHFWSADPPAPCAFPGEYNCQSKDKDRGHTGLWCGTISNYHQDAAHTAETALNETCKDPESDSTLYCPAVARRVDAVLTNGMEATADIQMRLAAAGMDDTAIPSQTISVIDSMIPLPLVRASRVDAATVAVSKHCQGITDTTFLCYTVAFNHASVCVQVTLLFCGAQAPLALYCRRCLPQSAHALPRRRGSMRRPLLHHMYVCVRYVFSFI